MEGINIKKLQTEQRNPNTLAIDTLSTIEMVKLINKEDENVPLAIGNKAESIAQACDAIVEAFKNGGRLVYIGAGTSGRMGVMDAAEVLPTYGISDKVVAILAGGRDAMFGSVEGAEDSSTNSIDVLKEMAFSEKDILVGIAASGRTPYVISALNYAKSIGAKTVALSCNENSEMGKIVDIPVEIHAGAEVITGSTRMKSGSVQKMVCNILTTVSMIKMGRVYSNLMVDMVATNKKLENRAINIIVEATGCSESEAMNALLLAEQNCKLAILFILSGSEIGKAKVALNQCNGYIREALKLLK